jgi:hypothetical protein
VCLARAPTLLFGSRRFAAERMQGGGPEMSSPLHRSAAQGQSNRLTMLLKKCDPIEVDALDADGHTPLFVASSLGQSRSAALLLHSGANPNHPTENSRSTPLHAACDAGHDILVAALLSAGALPLARDAHGMTPLDRAEHAGHHVCASVIKKHLGGDDAEAPAAAAPRPQTPVPARRPQTPELDQSRFAPHDAPETESATQLELHRRENRRRSVQLLQEQVEASTSQPQPQPAGNWQSPVEHAMLTALPESLPPGWASATSRSSGNVYYVRPVLFPHVMHAVAAHIYVRLDQSQPQSWRLVVCRRSIWRRMRPSGSLRRTLQSQTHQRRQCSHRPRRQRRRRRRCVPAHLGRRRRQRQHQCALAHLGQRQRWCMLAHLSQRYCSHQHRQPHYLSCRPTPRCSSRCHRYRGSLRRRDRLRVALERRI